MNIVQLEMVKVDSHYCQVFTIFYYKCQLVVKRLKILQTLEGNDSIKILKNSRKGNYT